ncbi:antibiotic biosynthesis monooxygenase family protein [Mycobacterium sp. 1274761.0]|uniref:putative quinol monooxygenase n=1 Tax=Mycobacterium sp. 1274761.0 TaxID=1834077 RepID=UPI0009ED2FEC
MGFGPGVVAGHLIVEPRARDDYLAGRAVVVEQGRTAPGCLDFAISAQLLDPARINIFERWDSQRAVEAFRGNGRHSGQLDVIASASASEYDVSGGRDLTQAPATSARGQPPVREFATPRQQQRPRLENAGAEVNAIGRPGLDDGRPR